MGRTGPGSNMAAIRGCLDSQEASAHDHAERSARAAPSDAGGTGRSSFPTCIWARAAAKPNSLADFLVRNSCETLFLVGDIVGRLAAETPLVLARRPQPRHRGASAQIDAGTRVVYVPGNHDEVLRIYCGRSIAGVEVMYEAVHETADGRQLLVLHGDRFDAVIAYAKWLAHLGDGAYTMALHLNEVCQRAAARIEPALLVALRLAERQSQ